jgi:5-methylcytosine-specific restriction endonuclease McrA
MALTSKALGSQKWKQLRLKVLARDGHQCWICHGQATQVDHIQSRKHGGDMWDQDNLAAICGACNRKKGSGSANRVFFRRDSTPPASPAFSLPETATTRPDGPFQKP